MVRVLGITATHKIEGLIAARAIYTKVVEVGRQRLHLFFVHLQRPDDCNEPLTNLDTISATGTATAEVNCPGAGLVGEQRDLHCVDRSIRILRSNILGVRYWLRVRHLVSPPNRAGNEVRVPSLVRSGY